MLPRIIFDSNEADLPVTFTRRQFPVRVAFAMTINKSQGQTFGRVGVDLTRDVFSHGQLYVAFSRVRNLSSLRVLLPSRNVRTTNVVYKEVFTMETQ